MPTVFDIRERVFLSFVLFRKNISKHEKCEDQNLKCQQSRQDKARQGFIGNCLFHYDFQTVIK